MPVANCNDSVASSRSSAARRSEPGDPPCQIVPKPNSSMASAMAGSRSLTPRQTPTAPRRLLQVMLVLPDSQEPQLCPSPRPVRRRPIRSLRQELVNTAADPADLTYDTTARNRQTRRRKPLARRRHISANEASRCKRWCVERALTYPSTHPTSVTIRLAAAPMSHFTRRFLFLASRNDRQPAIDGLRESAREGISRIEVAQWRTGCCTGFPRLP